MSNPTSVMAALRAQQRGDPPQETETPEPFNAEALRAAVKSDQGLSGNKRTELLQSLNDPAFLSMLKSSAIGGLLGTLVGKFMKLSGSTKLLLSLAGFGIGKIVYDFKRDQQQKNSSWYNDKWKMYELK